MLRRILVPLDGSAFAETALHTAVELARPAGAELRLVHVHRSVANLLPIRDWTPPTATDDLDRRGHALAYLEQAVTRADADNGVVVRSELLDGSPGPALAQRVDEWQPDLVVMTASGQSGAGSRWLGGVTDYLVRHVGAPLFILRPTETAAAPVPIRSILVPLDLSPSAEAVLAPAGALADAAGADLTLLHVLDPVLGAAATELRFPLGGDPPLERRGRDAATAYLETAARRLRDDGRIATTRVLVGSAAAAAILDEADRAHVSVVALASHGAGGLRRLLLGGVADKVLRASSRPVLLVQPAR